MRKRELLARIEMLEAKVAELEARMPFQTIYPPYVPPTDTYPTWPWYNTGGTGDVPPPVPYRVTCEGVYS